MRFKDLFKKKNKLKGENISEKVEVVSNTQTNEEKETNELDYDQVIPKNEGEELGSKKANCPQMTGAIRCDLKNTTSNLDTDASSDTVYVFPSTDLLPELNTTEYLNDRYYKDKLQAVFQQYAIKARIETVVQSDVSVTFGIVPNTGVRINNITSYKDEIMQALGNQIEFEIPLKGTTLLGIHLLKNARTEISLRKALETTEYKTTDARIPLLMGVLTSGDTLIEDLDLIGHLLIVGTTGSGKSVFLNSLINGILYKCDPTDVQFLFIDTNIVNLSVYNGINSLYTNTVTDADKALDILKLCLAELQDRIKTIRESACKDIDEYNEKAVTSKLPHIVIVIDEFTPLIESEPGIDILLSISNNGKAAGVHLIASTQKTYIRPTFRKIVSAFPARVAFKVLSESESKVVIDTAGAEKLAGLGDMLYRRQGLNVPVHIQGICVTDEDAAITTAFIRKNNPYKRRHLVVPLSTNSNNIPDQLADHSAGYDEYLIEAGYCLIDKGKASIGVLQRFFKIGFNRAANIMLQLEKLGVVSNEQGTIPRRVLMNRNEFEALIENLNL